MFNITAVSEVTDVIHGKVTLSDVVQVGGII